DFVWFAAFILPPLLGTRQRRQMLQRLVHRDEPLWGAAVDDLRLRPPRMRVAVLEVCARREQRTRLAQIPTDPSLRPLELRRQVRAAGRWHRAVAPRPPPPEPQPVGPVEAPRIDREDRIDAVGAAQLEIVLAMIGRHVDEARALVGGDEIARKERAWPGEEAA